MDERTENWIAAYLEWANIDGGAIELRRIGSNGVGEAGADPGDAFAAAYFEWVDAVRAGIEERSQPGPASELGALREAVLLDALRTESDCIHMLRQTLDTGGMSAGALRFAMETVERADRLLEDERRAWQLLRALRQLDSAQARSAAPEIDAEDDWSHALEGVVADMRSLTGQILALRAR